MNLFLRFQFTDRAGRRVYNIYEVEAGPVIGQIRLPMDSDGPVNPMLEWIKPEVEDEA